MTVFIAGPTGVLGRRVVATLAGRGHSVVGLIIVTLVGPIVALHLAGTGHRRWAAALLATSMAAALFYGIAYRRSPGPESP